MTRIWILAAGLLLVPAACAQAPAAAQAAQVVVDSFDTDTGGWKASSGTVSTAPDPERDARGNVLQWRYTLIKDFIFLASSAGADRWRGATAVAFRIRSDKPGRMFIRFDQQNKSAFFKDFMVGTSWQEVHLPFDQIKRASFGFQKLDGSRIATMYFVDLSGKDEGATGERTVWIDDLRAIGGAAAAPAAPADEGLDRVKEGIVLRAFDAGGNVVSLEQLKSYGVSGASYAYLSDLDHYPRPGELASSNGRDNGLPVLRANRDDTVAINVLFWPIPAFGKMWVVADNAGAGYRLSASAPKAVLNLNLELARSRLAQIERHLAARDRTAIPDALRARVTRLRQMVSAAAGASDDRAMARLADEALANGMELGEAVALEMARADIRVNRTGALDVEVVSANGSPVANAQVEIVQERNAFTFGLVQSLGFAEKNIPDASLARAARLAREAGFNDFTATLFWNHIQPRRDRYVVDEWDGKLGLDHFAREGFTFHGHGLLHAWLPDHVKNANKRTFASEVVRNFSEMISRYQQRYPGRFTAWQVSNEAASNRFAGMSIPEKIDLLKQVSATIRKLAPGTKVWINEVDWDRAQRFWRSADAHLRDLRQPLEFFELLNAQNVDFDIAGIEWYPGLRVSYLGVLELSEPMVDLLRTIEMLDRYKRIKQPLHITEFALPGTSDPQWRNGYRGKNWDAASQARFATEFYTVAFSRPHVHEITYWGLTDHEPWAIRGGLLDESFSPKPIYGALRTLLEGWRTRTSGRTDAKGRIRLEGFAGTYTVIAAGARSSAAITERGVERITVRLK